MSDGKSKKNVVIFGTGSFAEVVKFYLTHDSEYKVIAFCASANAIVEDEYLGLPLVPFEEVEKIFHPDTCSMFIAIGYAQLNAVRARFFHEAKAKGYALISYVSSKATHWGDTKFGENCFIFENNTIQPFVVIDNDTIVWSGNHIGHHTSIGAHCFITSHAVVSGHCSIGAYSFIGVNATIGDATTIGERNIIGPSALIQKNTGSDEVFLAERTNKHLRESSRFFR